MLPAALLDATINTAATPLTAAVRLIPRKNWPKKLRRGAEGGTRTPTGFPIRPSNVRVYQFHHFGKESAGHYRRRPKSLSMNRGFRLNHSAALTRPRPHYDSSGSP